MENFLVVRIDKVPLGQKFLVDFGSRLRFDAVSGFLNNTRLKALYGLFKTTPKVFSPFVDVIHGHLFTATQLLIYSLFQNETHSIFKIITEAREAFPAMQLVC